MLINEGGADFSMIKEADLLFKTLNPGAEITRDLSRQTQKAAVGKKTATTATPEAASAATAASAASAAAAAKSGTGNVAVVAPRPVKQSKNRQE